MAKEKRGICLSIRLTDSEYEALSRKAAELCMSMAGYIRYRAIKDLINESEDKDYV